MAEIESGMGGEAPPDVPPKLKDANLIRRAIKARWPIPEENRQRVMDELFDVATQRDDVRSKVAAAKAMIEADKVNMEQEKRDAGGDTLNVNFSGKLKHEHLEDPQRAAYLSEFQALATRLGVAGANGHAGNGQSVDSPHPDV